MIKVVYSTQHWIVPTITLMVLGVLLIAIIAVEGVARQKQGEAFIKMPGRFFIENYDKFKLWGTLILFIAYIFCLDIVGFTVTSIVFVFLFNLLYGGLSKKAILTSVVISVVGSLVISVLFGIIFNITLPGGFCSITFANFGFTIY